MTLRQPRRNVKQATGFRGPELQGEACAGNVNLGSLKTLQSEKKKGLGLNLRNSNIQTWNDQLEEDDFLITATTPVTQTQTYFISGTVVGSLYHLSIYLRKFNSSSNPAITPLVGSWFYGAWSPPRFALKVQL